MIVKIASVHRKGIGEGGKPTHRRSVGEHNEKGDYSLVLEAEKGEAEAALQYVEVLEDTEGA
jgi:hypothetical protein